MTIAVVTFLIFLVLKLVGVVLWPWWFITAPLWIMLLVFIMLLMIVAADIPEHADY